jgi:uncharacterized protein
MISIEEARRHYPSTRGGAHGFDHVLRVTVLAGRIAKEEGADLEIVRAAALLHDVAAAGPDRENHHLAGAVQAREILLALGRPAAQVEAVAHCVQTHRFRKPEEAPQTLEAQCVFDADKLDAIGAVGVARAFVYGAELGQPLWGKVSPEFKAGHETGEPYTAHHEFYRKLIRIRDRLYTQTGRRIAADRHRTMVDFFNRMAREVAGEA